MLEAVFDNFLRMDCSFSLRLYNIQVVKID